MKAGGIRGLNANRKTTIKIKKIQKITYVVFTNETGC